MSFKYNQRYAVYKVFGGICQWCKEPVDFKAFHVDHLLPEELLNNPQRLEAILKTYSLPDDFDINNYENWIPAHSACNQAKGDKVYEGLPLIKTILDACAKRKELGQRLELKLQREPEKAELLTRVQAAIELNLVNIDELQNFMLNTDIMDSDDKDLDNLRKSFEHKLEYQTDKMVKGMMDILRMQTRDVIAAICKVLGSDWVVHKPIIIVAKKGDTKYAVRYGLRNKVNSSLNVNIIVNPDVVNNELKITFRLGDDVLDNHIQDITKGINWELYRNVLRLNYIAILKQRAT